jgi:Transposase IS66 family
VPECREWNPFTGGKLLKGGRLEIRDRSVGAFVRGTMGVCKPGCLQTLGVCKPVAAIVAALSAHIDETSWSEANEKAWLWVGQTEDLTAFTIADNRGADVARSILGTDREKVVISDRFPSYDWIEQHQQARRGAGSRSVPRCPYSPE